MARGARSLLTIIFAIFWCSLVGVFDAVVAVQIAQQVDAQRRFLPASALILKSEVESHRGSKGRRTYKPVVDYQYSVPGEPGPRRGSTVSFFNWSSSDSSSANAVVNSNRPGSTVTAYYDPASPDRCVLVLPIPKTAWLLILFLTPFNCVGIGLAASAISRSDPDLVRTRDGGSTLTIVPRATPPLFLSLGAVGLIALLGAIIIAFSGTPTSTKPMTIGTLVAALAAGVAMFVIFRARGADPAGHLRFDRQLLKLTIPMTATNERAAPGTAAPARSPLAGQELAYMSIVDVRLKSKQTGSVNKKAWFKHRIVLRLADDRTDWPASVVALIVNGYRETGEAYKDRIKTELGLTEPGEPDSVELELDESGPVG